MDPGLRRDDSEIIQTFLRSLEQEQRFCLWESVQ